MGEIRVGTASWTDKTLIELGWYPPEAATPTGGWRSMRAARWWGGRHLYALPAEQTAATWAARTPAAFTVNVKAFSLFTGHPTR